MLYIQITTFFGSQCKLKMSCLRPNCCAARKMQFQLFFFPEHQLCPPDGCFHPGVCRSRGLVAPAATEGRRLGSPRPGASPSVGKAPLD